MTSESEKHVRETRPHARPAEHTEHAEHAEAEKVARLTLRVQRILDAEALGDAEGTALLTATEAARHSLAAGDVETARQHIAHVVHFIEALLCTDALVLAGGRAVIETARRILAEDTD